MTEAEARAWLTETLHVPRGTMDRLEQFLAMLVAEMDQQNLISRSSLDHIWARHVVDSAQLIPLAQASEMRSGEGRSLVNEAPLLPVRLRPSPERSGLEHQSPWLDLGTGAGFPGIGSALLTERPVIMVESRARRIDFLERVIAATRISGHARVEGKPLERVVSFPAAVISARAFAPLDRLLRLANRFSTEKTLWLLPKGKNAVKEWQELPKSQRDMFHVEHSITDADARILVGRSAGKKA
jgi:16S rRNA (guanine527-N7)-methyltransferase